MWFLYSVNGFAQVPGISMPKEVGRQSFKSQRFISSDLRFKTRVEWIEVSLKREIKILNNVRTQTDPIQNLLINCQTPSDKKRVRG